MKKILVGSFFMFICLLAVPQQAAALGLKVAPLQYKTSLKENERKKGFIDISNPSGQRIIVRTSVQALRQINDQGGLEFYTDKQIALGIKPDLKEFELKSREAVRMYFTVDGPKLPEGDIFAAIFFTTAPKLQKNGVGQLVRVGTVLSLVNKTPGDRKAQVTGLNMPFIQLSETASGSYSVKNTGNKRSGFYPKVNISAWPFGKNVINESSLVFGGRERSNDFTYKTGMGLHKIDVTYEGSSQSRWVITLAPWSVVIGVIIAVIVSIEIMLWHRRRSKRLQP